MILNKRITRKSFFRKLGLYSGLSVISGYHIGNELSGKSSLMTSKLETRFKKPSNIVNSEHLT